MPPLRLLETCWQFIELLLLPVTETTTDRCTLWNNSRLLTCCTSRQAALVVLADYRAILGSTRKHRALQVGAVAGLTARSLVAIAPMLQVPAIIRSKVRIAELQIRDGVHAVGTIITQRQRRIRRLVTDLALGDVA